MKVILQQDVRSIGVRGDVVEVSPGYGVNYLIAKGLGVVATPDAIEVARQASQQKKNREVALVDLVDSLARKAEHKGVLIKVNASKGGRLYGSMGEKEVISAIQSLWGTEGKGVSMQLDLVQPIQEVGRYPVELTLSGGEKNRKVDIVLDVVVE